MAQEFYTTNNTLLQNKIKSANNQKTCKSTTNNLIRHPVDCHYKKKKIFPNMMIKKMIILTRLVQYIRVFQNLPQISVTELMDMEIVEIEAKKRYSLITIYYI
jgi:hypothetical protein